jgi:hypothetical protein
MIRKRVIVGTLACFFLFTGICLAADQSILFEREIEFHGKGIADYNLPTGIETGYEPEMVGYWVAEYSTTKDGKPTITLEVILYGSDYQTGRNVLTAKLEEGESCLVFFYTEQKRPTMENLPQYCYVQTLDIDPAKKFAKLRHWVSRTPVHMKDQ